MVILRPFERILDFLGEILAFLTVLLAATLFLNGPWQFINNPDLLITLTSIRNYLIVGTVVVVGLEFSVKRNSLIVLIYLLLAAAVVLFALFPQVLPAFLQ